jgi:hypothetical protein
MRKPVNYSIPVRPASIKPSFFIKGTTVAERAIINGHVVDIAVLEVQARNCAAGESGEPATGE